MTHSSNTEVDPYRLYAIVRGDLNMTSGKTASQAGHAFLNSFIESTKTRPEVSAFYQRDGIGTKCCLTAKNEHQILAAHEKAMAAGIPCSLIYDSGHIMPPHFDGNPIITALGIGPARRHEINAITRKFPLCK